MRGAALALAAALGACQSAPSAPGTPAPAPCELAGFGSAPGLVLGKARPIPPARSKSGPLQFASSIPIGRDTRELGRWADAAPGWKAWRFWLRSEEASSVSVHIEPIDLPPGAELWLCSPDRTTRRGPVTGKGIGNVGQYWSPIVPGPELWIEVLAPAGREEAVRLRLVEAFAGAP